VLPVVPDFSHLDGTADRTVADLFDDTWTNVLFVGRMVPNKKLEDVIRFFHAYHKFYNPRSRLLLVGAHGGLERYTAALHQLTAALGNGHVHFVGPVSNEELVAFYEIADLFLCASEHEGFCVTIVEAFYKQIPVVAYAATAVPATMDGAGVLYHAKDPHVAALIDAAVSNVEVEDALIQGPASRRSIGCEPGTSPGCFSGSSTTSSRPRGCRPPESRSTFGTSSTQPKPWRSCASTGRRSIRPFHRHDRQPMAGCGS
jgi:glycosyltransferase involved in cell wall biosynthesis